MDQDAKSAGRTDPTRDGEKRYHTLAEHSGVGIWEVTVDGRTVYANRALLALLELNDLEDFAGRTFHAFFPPESQAILRSEHARRPAGIASTYEVVLVGQHGRRRTVLISGAPYFGPDGRLESLIGTFTDVTERKQTEQALRQIEELNRRILEAVPNGLVTVGPDGAIQQANAEAQRILGLSWNEMAHRFVRDWEAETVHEDGRPFLAEDYPVSRCLRTGQAQPGVVIGARRPKGAISWAIYSAVPISDPETGRASGAVVTLVDVTERKGAEEKLREYGQRLEVLTRHLGGQTGQCPAPDPYHNLTAREREVLQLTAEGHSGSTIAGRLFISPRTVESHRANLMRKLGLKNLKEVIRYAVQRRWLTQG